MATAKRDFPDPRVQRPHQLSIQEAAHRLGVSVATIYRYMAKGVLPFHKNGSQRYISLHDVEACKDARSFGSLEIANRRRMRARAAAHILHSLYDSRELTAAARDAFSKRFERQVDPEGLLSHDERLRRADQARRAYFTNLALRSAKSRSNGRRAHRGSS